ncbi:phosphotransferase [Brevibacillus fortis]|uniref:phosphotransferase n=1 Tax=Brevibacillus fortis TaxID=2126352 RepID=UPI002E236B81|nr:phosphotransferase [Brevibacillus fortis]
MSEPSKEELLAGGNVTNVYRFGNTVRREVKPESKNIHELLKHLERKGYPYSPKFLGVDEKGREILSFIEGEPGHAPLKEYMQSNEALQEIAKMLRLYHDSVSDFPFDDQWHSLDQTPEPREVICHNDFAMYNIIFHQQRPIGIIDFDVAAPGPRLWDIAYTLYTCVPFSRFSFSESGEKIHYQPLLHANQRKQRMALFFESYGMEWKENAVEMVLLRLEGLYRTIARKASEGDAAFQKMIEEGHIRHYQEDIAFIHKHKGEWV